MEFRLVNVSLELFACAMLLFLIIYESASEYRRTRTTRIFLLILYPHALLLIFDAISWAVAGTPGLFVCIIQWTSNFIVYSSGWLINIFLLMYVSASIPLAREAEQKIIKFCIVSTVLYFVILFVTQIHVPIFFFDDNNLFVIGPGYYIPVICVGGLLLAIIVFILYYREQLGRRKVLAFLLYPLIPIAVITVNIVFNLYVMVAHVVSALSLLNIFLNIQMQLEKKVREMEVELTESRISVMLSQIQPHFLYNSLSAIHRLCRGNAEAQKAVMTFSEYLRVNMDSLVQREPIPFMKELEHIQQYLWLEQLRFGQRLQVVYEINTSEFMLPVLTIQPIVENAVRYGITKKKSGGTVTIKTDECNDGFYITVADDGIGFDPQAPLPKERRHTGIANVREHLSAICGGVLTIDSIPGKGTIATIKIPKQPDILQKQIDYDVRRAAQE